MRKEKHLSIGMLNFAGRSKIFDNDAKTRR
jgi:hypothetical protein